MANNVHELLYLWDLHTESVNKIAPLLMRKVYNSVGLKNTIKI